MLFQIPHDTHCGMSTGHCPVHPWYIRNLIGIIYVNIILPCLMILSCTCSVRHFTSPSPSANREVVAEKFTQGISGENPYWEDDQDVPSLSDHCIKSIVRWLMVILETFA